MRRIFLFLILVLPCVAVQGGEVSPSFFTSAEWQQLGVQLPTDQDLVVFKDGRKVLGTVEKVPMIQYTFGEFQLEVDQVFGIAFATTEQGNRIQCITVNGYNLIGSMPEKSISFIERKAIIGKGKRSTKNKLVYQSIARELNPDDVSFILLKAREDEETPLVNFHNVQFKNGDQFPVLLTNQEITLSDGWKQKKLNPRDISSISFDGGIHGTVWKQGEKEKLSYSFTQDPYLEMQIAFHQSNIKIPWEKMETIWEDQGEYHVAKPAISSRINIEDKVALSQLMLQDEEEPEPIAVIQPKLDLSKMVFIPSGKFRVKNPGVKGQMGMIPTANAPSFAVDVPDYYIDSQYVTNQDYQFFVEATGHRMPNHWARGGLPKGFENHPVVNVSYEDALSYANWTGKRLPDEIEWEIAKNQFSSNLPAPLEGRFAEWTAQKQGCNPVLRRDLASLEPSDRSYPERFTMSGDQCNTYTGFRCVLPKQD